MEAPSVTKNYLPPLLLSFMKCLHRGQSLFKEELITLLSIVRTLRVTRQNRPLGFFFRIPSRTRNTFDNLHPFSCHCSLKCIPFRNLSCLEKIEWAFIWPGEESGKQSEISRLMGRGRRAASIGIYLPGPANRDRMTDGDRDTIGGLELIRSRLASCSSI